MLVMLNRRSSSVVFNLLILTLLLTAFVTAQEIKGFVNDYAGVLSADEKAQIENIAKGLYDKGATEYAVVIVDSLEGRDIEGYAFELAEGRLGSEEKNNGLLLLVTVQDRRYRFEVGRGLEPEIPDIIAGRIGRDYLAPNFREEKYGKGIIEASKAIEARLQQDTNSSFYLSESMSPERVYVLTGNLLATVIFLIVLAILMRSQIKKRRGVRVNDSDYFIAAWALSQMLGRGRGGGGFGGGSFGGGGASGGW